MEEEKEIIDVESTEEETPLKVEEEEEEKEFIPEEIIVDETNTIIKE